MMADQSWACSMCTPTRTFESSDQLRTHALNYHASSFTVTIHPKAGSSEQVTVTQKEGAYHCPFCRETFKTKGGCRKHLINSTCATEEQDNDDPGQQPPVIAMPSEQCLPVPNTIDSTSLIREYNDAILYSCNQTHVSDAEKQRTLAIVDALGLTPFAIKDSDGAEQNGLAHTSVVAKLSTGQSQVAPNMPSPKKRKHTRDDTCPNCTPTQAPGLEYVLSASPYAASIQRRKYFEIDNGNGQVIIVNTVETYGRTKLVDAHREPFVVRKGQPVANSLPPSIKTPYKNVWPTTVPAQDGERLIIGTLSFDALITSSLRLDTRMSASVGCSTPSFLLSSTSHSLATRIYLDQESLDDGLRLAHGKDTWCVSSSNIMWQLRQTKTKFHDPSTYYLCRSSSPFANKHPCQPFTIFTLLAYDQSHSGDGVVLSRLFHTIASRVIQDAREAVIDRQMVEDLRDRCTDQTNASKGLDLILELFSGTQTTIKILGNLHLNNALQTLAPLISTYISKANASVVAFVEKEIAPTR
ncbi:hypothetical protein F5H01DRAFT_385294 [Linnemannia elongata]|nr:hypothetical protein F5H01DRAFT_385294 [Linnemannia elongata]